MYGMFTLWLIHPEKEMCDAFRERFSELPKTKVIQSSYEELPPHDCFATAANSFGIMNAGIDAAVIRVFGVELMKQIQFRIMDEYLGEQLVGTAFIHATEKKEYPFLVHAPTMRVPGSIDGKDNIYRATWATLLTVNQHNLTSEHKIETLVFPAFGTGFGGVPYSEAARQMAVAYKNYLNPPHRIGENWDYVLARQKAISYDGNKRVIQN